MNAYICQFKPHSPPKSASQDDAIKWLQAYHEALQERMADGKPERVDRYLQKFAVKNHDIAYRSSYVPGLGEDIYNPENFFHTDNLNPNLDQRSEIARKAFDIIFQDLYEGQKEGPHHLLHVTCTFYESPSAAQKLLSSKNWTHTTPTHLYHMGCYASLPAIRTAKALSLSEGGQIDIVHTEICSLHLSPKSFDPEQLIVQTLFADGAIKYKCLNEDGFLNSKSSGFKIKAMLERILPQTSEEMTWKTGAFRFDMTLGKKTPTLLVREIEHFCEELFSKAGLQYSDYKSKSEFAIHPGGPKILSTVKDALKLSDEQIQTSVKVLLNRGNMSSATLPHIWKKILEKPKYKYVVTIGFGPGLTLTGALFEVCKARGC